MKKNVVKILEKIEVEIEKWVKEKPLSLAIRAIILTILICFFFTLIIFLSNLTHITNFIDITKTGPLGDTFNGILGPFIAFLVALLTFLAFYIQYRANELQNNSNKLLQFESKFFEMIRIHRENILEMNYTKYYKTQMTPSTGRKTFKIIFREFIECKSEISMFFQSKEIKDIYQVGYANQMFKIIDNINPLINLVDLAKINIAYAIVFFGVGKEGELALKSLFRDKYDKKFYFEIIKYLQLKPKEEEVDKFAKWTILKNIRTLERRKLMIAEFFELRKNSNYPLTEPFVLEKLIYDNKYDKYYGGHQHRLGHYFRHLYQSYTYLNSHSNIQEEEKYFYGKTLRAQLSNYEQALLLVNGISSLGMNWEYAPELKLEENRLITKYNLIKNLPGEHLFGIRYKLYFPKVNFESDEQ